MCSILSFSTGYRRWETARRPLPKYSYPKEVLEEVRGFWPGGVADHSSPPGAVKVPLKSFLDAFP